MSTLADYKYQKAKKTHAELFCDKCETFVKGSGTMKSPYVCLCGGWEYDPILHNWKLGKVDEL